MNPSAPVSAILTASQETQVWSESIVYKTEGNVKDKLAEDLVIRIPAETVRKIELLITGSRYKSPEEYILSLIRETSGDIDSYSDQEEKEIKRRLSSLGYE